MKKQYETITVVSCPYCGYKILATWRTQKELSDVEKYERQQRALNDHIELHEMSKKYLTLSDYVRQMAKITGDDDEHLHI